MRGATLIVTVLITTVAATIALVLLRQVLTSSVTAGQTRNVAKAEESLSNAQSAFEAQLAKDPTFFLSTVWSTELPSTSRPVEVKEAPRTCAAGTVNPGAAWSVECGTSWSYEPAASTIVAHITPPSTTSAFLTLDLATSTPLLMGRHLEYLPLRSGQYVLWSTQSLDLADLTTTGAPVTVNGSIYTGGTLTVPTSGNSLGRVSAQAEDGFIGPLSPSGYYYSATPDESATPPIGSISTVTPAGSSAMMSGAVDSTLTVACPGDAGTVPVESVTPNQASFLCLRSGGSYLNSAGETGVFPVGVHTWRLIPHTGAGTVDVYADTSAPAVDLTCPVVGECNFVELAAPLVNSGDYAGAGNYWQSKLVATVQLPHSGIIGSDANLWLGDCNATATNPHDGTFDMTGFLTSDGSCSMTEVSTNLTIAANGEIWIAGPVTTSGDAKLALLTGANVVVPWFATTRGGNATVEASTVATGPFKSYPSGAFLPGDPAASNRGGTITLDGTFLSSNLDWNMTGIFDYRTLTDAALMNNPPSWLPGPVDGWEPVHSTILTADEAATILG